MLALLFVALLGSAAAAPQLSTAPARFGANVAHRLIPFGTPVVPGSPVIAPVSSLAPVGTSFVPARTVIHRVPAFAPATSLAPARTLFQDAPAFAPVAPLAPAAAPLPPVAAPIAPARAFIQDSSAFAPASPAFAVKPAIVTVQKSYQADESGQFSLSHTDSAGSTFQETGSLVPTNDGLDKALIKSGSFSYTSPEGTPIKVTYTADARGFHPISSAIPI